MTDKEITTYGAEPGSKPESFTYQNPETRMHQTITWGSFPTLAREVQIAILSDWSQNSDAGRNQPATNHEKPGANKGGRKKGRGGGKF